MDFSDMLSRHGLELEHYGIKGMHWGVRRNPGADGVVGKTVSVHSPGGLDGDKDTSSDHERVTKALVKAQKRGTSALSNEELKAIATRAEAEKKLRQLSDGEKSAVQKRVEQLRLEKELRQLESEHAKAMRSTGRKLMDSLVQTAAQTAQEQMADYGKTVVQDLLGVSQPTALDRMKKENEGLKIRKEHRQLKKDLYDLGERSSSTPFKVNPSKVKIGG